MACRALTAGRPQMTVCVLTAGAGAAGSQPVGFGLGLLACGCGGAVSHRRNLGGDGEMADGGSLR